MSAAEIAEYLDEIESLRLGTKLIGFTGGEPFMNPELPAMLDIALARGFRALVLTNAMKPMHKMKPALLALRERYGERLQIRVSIDHYGRAVHEVERGRRSWQPTIDGLLWLAANGFAVSVASRRLSGEREAEIRRGFAGLFDELGLALDAEDPVALTVFPEMDAAADVPEITEACWGLLGKSPDSVMCAELAHGGEVQGGGAAERHRLHAPALRPALRPRPDPGGGARAGRAQPPALRQILRPRRRRLQPGMSIAQRTNDFRGTGSLFWS